MDVENPTPPPSAAAALASLHGLRLASPYAAPFGERRICRPGPDQRPIIRGIWRRAPSCLSPALHCNPRGDLSAAETIANVLTSLPFIALGIRTPRKDSRSAAYANSLIGVGVASSLYHSSRGRARKMLRWADYTMIAAATLCLSGALREEGSPLLMAASAFGLPFRPFAVSIVHTGLTEVALAKRAMARPELRTAHGLHTVSSLVGAALFVADDMFPGTPFMHAAWHVAAAVGVGTCNKLLE